MKKDETLYVTDLDGTLLNDDQMLSKKTTSYLTTAIKNGLNFTFATARSLPSSRFVIESLDLQFPVILYNGAQIYCPKKKAYIHDAYMESNVFSELLAKLLEDGLDPVVHCLSEENELRVYFKSVSNESTAKWVNSRLQKGDKRFRVTTNFSEVVTSKVIELMVVGSYEQLTAYEDMLKSVPSVSYILSEDIYCKGHYWLEISHVDANKGFAVEKLRDYLGLTHIVSFGDNHNDVPMFKKSTHSLAVGNAPKSVQVSASEVIGLNNDDAVVSYLELSGASGLSYKRKWEVF